MGTKIFDGKALAKQIYAKLEKQVLATKKRNPGLAAILVGNDEASKIYVSYKQRMCSKIGIQTEVLSLAEDASQTELASCIEDLNQREDIDGILLQLPLPNHLDPQKALNIILPKKDIDGLSAVNLGSLQWQNPRFVPCTALAVMRILQNNFELKGKLCAVVGLNPLSGGSVATLLSQEKATVIAIHKDSKDPHLLCSQVDIVVTATGQKHLINERWIKKDAIVVDIGISRENERIYGDVDQKAIEGKASFVTPVPGGVGPVTIAMLAENTLKAFRQNIINEKA